ncbi:Protein MIZU-KUSSEI 1 [Quillaja saponaria]|uniref:Protein MIZU-KUSSEI 1 n=1 Tax=Quillaja saponaria TaxID=32244 RepID=A0AAD7VNA8_QUISA|nr:Protein MIZU-KUSSEI 1 [Quillaja saponaria]
MPAAIAPQIPPPPPAPPKLKSDAPKVGPMMDPRYNQPLHGPISLLPSSNKKPSKSTRFFRRFRSVFRAFPIISPSCKFPVSGSRLNDVHINGGTRMTGTLFGYRKARVNLAIQESPRCLPILLLELAIPTGKLLQDTGMGLVRIALECEKKPTEKIKIIEEPIWTLYCNGKKTGYGVKREPTDDDLNVMQVLHTVSMGAGLLPAELGDPQDGELTYMRAFFERVIGSKDSETYYMMNPDGNTGPELSLFFVRI